MIYFLLSFALHLPVDLSQVSTCMLPIIWIIISVVLFYPKLFNLLSHPVSLLTYMNLRIKGKFFHVFPLSAVTHDASSRNWWIGEIMSLSLGEPGKCNIYSELHASLGHMWICSMFVSSDNFSGLQEDPSIFSCEVCKRNMSDTIRWPNLHSHRERER